MVTLLASVVVDELPGDHGPWVSPGVMLGKVKTFLALRSITASLKVAD